MNNSLLSTYGHATVPMQFVGPVDSSAEEYEWLAANVPDASVDTPRFSAERKRP